MSGAETEPLRCGFVAVLGAPNAGKSTLVNALVGQKVSIVTHKVQTTRFRVRGVALHGEAQIVLVDTPGVFKPNTRLERSMVAAAWAGAGEADAMVHVVDASSEAAVLGEKASGAARLAHEDAERVAEGLKASERKAILVLNKVDAVRKELLPLIAKTYWDAGVYSDVFMISAESGSGVGDLRRHLAGLMPEGVWLYPEDQIADLSQRLLAAEITREKVYLRLHQELPYAAHVETTGWQERPDGSVRIEQTIFVERESQRPIALGKGGQTIKWISQAARADIAEALGRPAHLFLEVRVDPRWTNSRDAYEGMGLDFDV